MNAEAHAPSKARTDHQDSLKSQVRHCFEATTADYKYWSKNLHMHFGVWRFGVNPLNLEKMLEEACLVVFEQFSRDRDASFDILDAGCGVGSSLDMARRYFGNARCYGINLVPDQVDQARAKLGSQGCHISLNDFEATDFPDASFDVIFSIEAAVYGQGKDKQLYLAEMSRILRPGGVLVVMDGYLTKPAPTMGRITSWIYRQVCRGWAIAEMIEKKPFVHAAQSNGLTLERFRWLSLAISPSVAHVPIATARYLWDSLARKRRRSRDSILHVISCVCGCLLGLQMHRFCYGMAVFRKR